MKQLDEIQSVSEMEEALFCKRLLQKEFTMKLFDLTKEIVASKSEADHAFQNAEEEKNYITEEMYDEALNQKELWYFAPRLGSFIERTNPALEFLKFTCKMFGLEKSLKGTVDILKRGCLRVLRIGEFDERSIFYEPTLELILPQATCHLCQSSFNLDICKEYDEEQNGWTCQDCGTLLKSNYIEKKMIDLLTSRMISYQIQDIECKNCKMIKNTVLGKICSCTGTFKNTH